MADYAQVAAQYRDRAEDVRKLARRMDIQSSRAVLERAAEDCETMAEYFERIAVRRAN